MPLLYGEGERAFVRLQEEILKETDDQSLFLWGLSLAQTTKSDELCGLLAHSPRLFSNVDFDYVRPLPPSRSQESAPVSITNQGLKISLMLISCKSKDDAYYALLDCVVVRPRDQTKNWSPYIILRRLWGDQFARIASPDEASEPLPYEELASKDGSVRLHPVVGPHVFDEDAQGSYRTIYVRQNPFDSLPEVTIRSNYLRFRPESLRLTFSVVDAYPPDRWDAILSVLRIRDPGSGGTIVALRFASETPIGQFFVDMTVGLHRVGERWEVCYEEHPYAGVGSQIGDVYREHPHISIPSAEKFHDGFYAMEAVTETQRRGRRFIQLDVFGFSKHHAGSFHDRMPQPTKETTEPSQAVKEKFQRISDNISVTSRQCCYVEFSGPSIYAALPASNGVRTRYPGDLSDLMDRQFDNITIPEDKPYFELMKAIEDGNSSDIRTSIAINRSLVESTIEELDGCKPIHCATSLGLLGAVKTLVRLGADVQAYTKSGLMPIHLAVLRGRFDIACELATAELTQPTPPTKGNAWKRFLTRQQETVLHLLAAYRRPEWADDQGVERLFEILDLHTAHLHTNNYGELALHRAAATGNMEEVFDAMGCKQIESLNPGIPSPHARDKFGRSLVFHAACGGNASIIRKLVLLGASVYSTDEHGRGPIHAAVMAGQASAVEALLDMGADPNSFTSIDRLTPLHLACLYGFEACVEELLRPDVSKLCGVVDRFPAGITHGGFQAIHVAAGNGHVGCVAKLLQYGCKLKQFVEGNIRLRESKPGTLKEGELVVFQTPMAALDIATIEGQTEIYSQIDASLDVRWDGDMGPI